MGAQSPRAGTSRGSLTKSMAEKGHPSDVRGGKAPSVGGISEWLGLWGEGGHKKPISPLTFPRWLGRIISGRRGSQLPGQAKHPSCLCPSLEVGGDP